MQIKISGAHLPGNITVTPDPNENLREIFQRVNRHVGYRFGKFEIKSFKVGTHHHLMNFGDCASDDRAGVFFRSPRPLLEALATSYVNWMHNKDSKWFRCEQCCSPHTLTVEPNYESLVLMTQFKTMRRNLFVSSTLLKDQFQKQLLVAVQQLLLTEQQECDIDMVKRFDDMKQESTVITQVSRAGVKPRGHSLDGYGAADEHFKYWDKRLLRTTNGFSVSPVCIHATKTIFVWFFCRLVLANMNVMRKSTNFSIKPS